MAEDQLSASELAQLKEIAEALPAGHPALNKVNLLLSSQPTQFEKERPGGGTLEGDVRKGYKAPSDMTGVGSGIWEGIKGLGAGALKSIDPSSGLSGAALTAIGMNPREGSVSERLHEIPAVGAIHEMRAAHRDPVAKPLEVPLAGLGSLVGESAESSRGHAARGESGAIIGEAAVPAATAALSPGLARMRLPAISEIGKGSSSLGHLARAGGTMFGSHIGGPLGAVAVRSLIDSLMEPGTSVPKAEPTTVKPIGSAELPKVKSLEPIKRMPEEIYQRPIEPAPGAGKEPAPAEMHPDELAAIRKEAGNPAMTVEDAHRFRVNKMASTAAAAKPEELPRVEGINRLEPADKAKSPRGYFNPGRSEPVKLENLVDQAAGVKPLRPEVPLREQLTSRPAASLEEVDPVKAKYPDPAVRQMVRANGEAIYEAAKGDPATVKAIHDLTRVDLRQALINAGEDMGQTTVSNSKFAGEGSIPREEAFSLLLKRGLSPERIIELAKKKPK